MNAKDAIPPIWTTGTTEVFKTGTWRAALPQHIRAPSPCHAACPVNGDIAEWIGRARAHDFHGAWEILTHHNPFPAIAGRICHHPCEAACNRAGFDESLAICKLERFVGDLALEQCWAFAPVEVERKERVAVVGGGPSGLSAAYQLRRRGYAVTLFESQPELGGLMRYGIPPYRLARSVLDGEIDRIVALGVVVRRGEALATSADFARLRAEYDTVYLAIGARRQKRLPQLDYAQPWSMDGAEYLARVNSGGMPKLGKRVTVIGGGSAALDVARSARRAGHEVTILALESERQMPAQREEITEALEEGIVLVGGAMLISATETGAGLRLDCVRVRFEPGAQRGQFTVAPVAGSEFALAADAVIPSIGQDPDLAPVQAMLDTEGALLKADAHQATNLDRVYAGGDVSSMARFVTEAIGMGKRAALQIDRVLGAGLEGPLSAEEPAVKLGNIATFYYPKEARAIERKLEVAKRFSKEHQQVSSPFTLSPSKGQWASSFDKLSSSARTGFNTGDAEVQLGFELEQTLAESARCFSCGTCIFCDNCVNYCPDLAVKRRTDGEAGYIVLTDYCKGCGLCVKECPTGSMKMLEEAR